MAEVFGFGSRLKTLRAKHGLSQKQLSDVLQVPQTTISFVENRPNLPRTALLEKIMQHFSVEISYFHASSSPAKDDQADRYLANVHAIKTGACLAAEVKP